jgi:hypothetical protein
MSRGERFCVRKQAVRRLRTGAAFTVIGLAGLLFAVAAVAGQSVKPPAKPPKKTTSTVTTTVATTTTVAATTTVATTTTLATTTVLPPTTQIVAAPSPHQPVADISVTTMAPVATAFFAESTPTYTSVVTNTGPDTATGVYLTVQPDGARVLASVAAGGSCSTAAGVECSLGSLASGASAVVTVTLQPVTGSSHVVHTAQAGADEPDPQAGNNITRRETPVFAGHPGPPALATPGGAFQPPLFARAIGNAWVVSTTVHIDEPARLTVQVLDAKGQPVTMLAGTLVNYLPARRPHLLIPHQIDRALWVPLQLRIRGTSGRNYRIVARATGPDGSSSSTTIRFGT